MRNVSILGAVLAASMLTQAASLGATVTRPTLTITYPTANLSVTNADIRVSGKTKDTAGVTNVVYQLNGAGWTNAFPTNGWATWTANVTLMPGTNILQAYAVDSAGTTSLTSTVKFSYVVMAPLVVHVNGVGTVTPNDNGKWLKIGTQYSMTAKAGLGFGFVNWTGTVSSSKSTLSFVMASNLTFTANFKDVTPPVLVIRSPTVHQSVSAAALTVTGKASDNVGVTQVFYQLNGTGWNLATPNPGWSNWTAEVTLSQGPNVVQAYALDAAGNPSKTNSVSFTYGASASGDLAPSSLSGLLAAVDGATGFTLGFGASTFSQSMLPGADESKSGVGTYTYTKLSATTALLTVNTISPPAAASTSVVHLTFTNPNEADYSTTHHNGTPQTGTVLFSQAPDLAPTTLAGDTVDLVDSTSGDRDTTVFASSSLTNTNQTTGEVSTGPYTFKQYSPVGGLITVHFASISGYKDVVAYYITTFSASGAGTWIADFVAPQGDQIHVGTFTLR
ncbi:MAG TPA: Ig-like domain-containing protein [Dongiaceae bacterium]|nr:Ig-like domain-containing protein [Dongiaceae bacterium]